MNIKIHEILRQWANVWTILHLVIFSSVAEVLMVTDDNWRTVYKYRLSLILFSSESCRFSQKLKPIYEETSTHFMNQTGKHSVLFCRVNCDTNEKLCLEQAINKFPTIKLLRYGNPAKQEYWGPRSVEGLSEFVHEQIQSNIIALDARKRPYLEVTNEINTEENTVVGIFPNLDDDILEYQFFQIAAYVERDSCDFYVVHNSTGSELMLFFKEFTSGEIQNSIDLKRVDHTVIHQWIREQCTPSVREITFHNALEIISEGLPLLLFFYNDEVRNLRVNFHEMVKTHFQREKNWINFLTADGQHFAHPLEHVGRSSNDLPLIFIDSLVHMYECPDPPLNVLSNPDTLKVFLGDFRSGKLHAKFHEREQIRLLGKPPTIKVREFSTTPTPSVFKKLGPSHLKYTLRHDEL